MELLKKMMLMFAVLFSATLPAQDYKPLQEAFQKSIELENKKDYTAAIDALKPYATVTSYEANVRLGWLNYLAGKHNESVACYTKAIALKPAATEPLWGIAYPLAELKKWPELQSSYLKIISLDPKNTTANYRLGLNAYYAKDYPTAKKYFEIVLNLYPLDYNALLMNAWTSYFLGKPAEAKVQFNKVLMVMPDDKSATEGLMLLK